MTLKTRASIEDLYGVEGKAEIVNGEIVHMPATGWASHYAAIEITVSLRSYVRRQQPRKGFAVGDNAAFRVSLPHRDSFSPDAAYHEGPNPGRKFFGGAPRFAVEVRSEGDYGPAAEREIEARRADYFAAGTQVVWDVDLLSPDAVRVYRATSPDWPTLYRRGEVAEAEPAVPRWAMPVDDLFEP